MLERKEQFHTVASISNSREIEFWERIEASDTAAEPDSPQDSSNFLWDSVGAFGKFLSYVLEFGLWIFVAILLGVVIATRDRWLPYVGFSFSQPRRAHRVFLSSGEVKAESLPSDLPAEVRRLWRDGKKRSALSLLYRGSVYAAVAHYGVRVPRSATEGLCLAAVNEQTSRPRADFFARIVVAWTHCAYGLRNPEDAAVVAICEDWQTHFGEPQ